MTQQLLHRPQIGPAVEQMGGEGVAQGMGARGIARATVEDAPDVAWREPAPPPVEEGGIGRRVLGQEVGPALLQPCPYGFDRWLAHRHPPLLVALAPHRDPTLSQLEVGGPETTELGDPETAAVEELDDR